MTTKRKKGCRRYIGARRAKKSKPEMSLLQHDSQKTSPVEIDLDLDTNNVIHVDSGEESRDRWSSENINIMDEDPSSYKPSTSDGSSSNELFTFDDSSSNEPFTPVDQGPTSLKKVSVTATATIETDLNVEGFSFDYPHPRDKPILDLIHRYPSKRATLKSLYSWNNWRHNKTLQGINQPAVPFFYELCGQGLETLDQMLAKFVKECKNMKDNEDYTPRAFRGILFGLQRYLKAYYSRMEMEPPIFFNNESRFPKFNEATKKKMKILKAIVSVKQNGLAQGVTAQQEEHLWNVGMFGCDSAEALTNTVIFYTVKIFGIFSFNALTIMKADSFIFGENDVGKYVELDSCFANVLGMFEKSSCCHNWSLLAPNTGTKLRHYCDESNPRTYYNILKYYLEKIKTMNHKNSSLFLIPKKETPKKELSFTNKSIGHVSLQRRFWRMIYDSDIHGYYTAQALVQSCLQNLYINGHIVKTNQSFLPKQQLQICKLLDPPVGVVKHVKIQTKAIIQLVNPHQQDPAQTQPYQNSLQYDSIHLNKPSQLSCQLVPGTDHKVQSAVQVSQDIIGTGLKPPSSASYVTDQLSVASTVLPQTQVVSQTVPVPSTNIDNVRSKSIQVVNIKQEAPSDLTQEMLPVFETNNDEKNISAPVSSTEERIGSATNENDSNGNNVYANDCNGENAYKNDTRRVNACEDDSRRVNAYENDSDAVNVYENYTNGANANENVSNGVIAYVLDDIIIKQEREEFEETCHHLPESRDVDEKEMTRKRKLKIDDVSNDHLQRKSTKTENEFNESNRSIDRGYLNNESNRTEESEEDDNDSKMCSAEVVYSFKNDLVKKITQQEISLLEDGETTFSSSSISKMGKQMSDLDFNLGDYLPENCTIKPENINISRMMQPDGGKMVVKLKYSPE